MSPFQAVLLINTVYFVLRVIISVLTAAVIAYVRLNHKNLERIKSMRTVVYMDPWYLLIPILMAQIVTDVSLGHVNYFIVLMAICHIYISAKFNFRGDIELVDAPVSAKNEAGEQKQHVGRKIVKTGVMSLWPFLILTIEGAYLLILYIGST